MSQKIVNQKKRQEEKLKKQKQQKKIAVILIVVVVLACVGGIVYMIYDNHKQEEALKEAEAKQQAQIELSRQETNSSKVNVDAVLDYLSGLDTELLNEEIAPEINDATTEAASAESVENQ